MSLPNRALCTRCARLISTSLPHHSLRLLAFAHTVISTALLLTRSCWLTRYLSPIIYIMARLSRLFVIKHQIVTWKLRRLLTHRFITRIPSSCICLPHTNQFLITNDTDPLVSLVVKREAPFVLLVILTASILRHYPTLAFQHRSLFASDADSPCFSPALAPHTACSISTLINSKTLSHATCSVPPLCITWHLLVYYMGFLYSLHSHNLLQSRQCPMSINLLDNVALVIHASNIQSITVQTLTVTCYRPS